MLTKCEVGKNFSAVKTFFWRIAGNFFLLEFVSCIMCYIEVLWIKCEMNVVFLT